IKTLWGAFCIQVPGVGGENEVRGLPVWAGLTLDDTLQFVSFEALDGAIGDAEHLGDLAARELDDQPALAALGVLVQPVEQFTSGQSAVPAAAWRLLGLGRTAGRLGFVVGWSVVGDQLVDVRLKPVGFAFQHTAEVLSQGTNLRMGIVGPDQLSDENRT